MVRKLVSALAASAALFAAVACQAADLKTGDKAPDFKAVGVDGKEYTLASAGEAKVVVVCFTCNRCPVAVAYEDRFIEFAKQYADKGVQFIAINVNSGEDLEAMKQRAEEKGFNFPYAYEESGDSCRAYGARVTPHLFVLDGERTLAYQGAFDDDQRDPKTPYVQQVVDALLAGKEPPVTESRAVGCGIQPRR